MNDNLIRAAQALVSHADSQSAAGSVLYCSHLIQDLRTALAAAKAALVPVVVPEDVREALADYAHEAWSGWMFYMLNDWTADNLARWRKQMVTPYAELSEREKESDRKEADRMLAIVAAKAALDPRGDAVAALQRVAAFWRNRASCTPEWVSILDDVDAALVAAKAAPDPEAPEASDE